MTKHEYICAIAEVVRSKSDCSKRQVGAVFVNQDYEILATGYNAPPRGFPHCDREVSLEVESKAQREENAHTCGSPCDRNLHAEMNAICQAAKRGTSLRDSVLYCTYSPCVDCARMIVNLGVSPQVWVKHGNNDGGEQLLQNAGIAIRFWGEKK